MVDSKVKKGLQNRPLLEGSQNNNEYNNKQPLNNDEKVNELTNTTQRERDIDCVLHLWR